MAKLALINRERKRRETVKKFALLDRDFTMADGELTPTLKVKRKAVEQNWSAEIDAIYRERDPRSASTFNQMAWIRATAPDPDVRNGRQAKECTW